MADIKIFTLIRFAQGDRGTFGQILFNGLPLCVSLEPPWMYNAVGKSCIPIGSYPAVLTPHPEHGLVYQLQNVPGRTDILIHSGCFAAGADTDTQGCVLIGTYHGPLWDIATKGMTIGNRDSRAAFSTFMKTCGGDKIIQVNIVPATPDIF
jgi:hypothetical protein